MSDPTVPARRARPGIGIGLGIAWLATLLGGPGAAPARGAELELTAFGGGQQAGDLSTREGSLELSGSALFGVGLGWRVRPDALMEVTCSHQESAASGTGWDGPERFDVTLDSVELAGLLETRDGRLRPFFGLAAGGTRLAGPEAEVADGWWLSGSVFGGIRYAFGAHALLRLEARASGILLGEGGALSCSTYPGRCSLALSGSVLGAFSARLGITARF